MRWLENRVPPPVVGLALAALMWGIAQRSYVLPARGAASTALAVVLAAAGPLMALLAIREFRKARTTVDPVHIERASTLVTGGIFSLTRNPMYLGLTLVLTGFGVWLTAPWSLIGPILFVAFITRFQIIPEERTMRSLFRDAYDDYCRRTRRWI